MEWIVEYLHITHSEAVALEIIEDIDHQCMYSANNFHSLSTFTVFQLFHHFLAFEDSLMVKITINE
jgi:hypothetical protein